MNPTKLTSSGYAPVIIPTLCRYEHFKNCLESLMRCTGAEMTDVYIGLDHPAKESHVEGWQEINTWLNSIQDTHPFQSLNIIRREHNYGLGPNGNFTNLYHQVSKNYDRVICSEDDNIFAPAFLDYINKGLEKFKDDFSVLAINGYRHFYDVKFEGNNFYRQNVDFSAWGYGIWSNRVEMANRVCNTTYWRGKAVNPLNWIKISMNGWNRTLGFLRLIAKPAVINDNWYSVYMGINNMDVIMPKVSMVRNMGWDGTGEHCQDDIPGLAQMHTHQSIYNGNIFSFIGTGREYYKDNRRIYVKQSYGRLTITQFFKKVFKYLTAHANRH